jgi:hypothetical protein
MINKERQARAGRQANGSDNPKHQHDESEKEICTFEGGI